MKHRPVARVVCAQAIATAVLTILVTFGSTAHARVSPTTGPGRSRSPRGRRCSTRRPATTGHSSTVSCGRRLEAGKGLKIDGANDYVNLLDPTALEAQAFSIALWVKRAGAQRNSARLLTKGGKTTDPWASYKIEFSDASDDLIRVSSDSRTARWASLRGHSTR